MFLHLIPCMMQLKEGIHCFLGAGKLIPYEFGEFQFLKKQRTESDTQYSVSVSNSVLLQKIDRARHENSQATTIEKELSGLLNQLLKPEYIEESTNQELLQYNTPRI